MNKKDRYYEIDLFRFLAAMSVVMYHYTFRGYAADDMSPIYYPYLADITKFGFLGLDLFFMISGFVILLTATNRDFKGFLISRIIRLYPAFWIAATLTAIVILLFGGERYDVGLFQYLANMTMLSGYMGIKPIDDVYWTLIVEITFYVMIGVLLLTNQIKNIKYYLLAWLLITAVSLYVGVPSVVRVLLILDWSSYFIAGAVLYMIRKDGVSVDKIAMILVSYFLSLQFTYDRLDLLNEHYNTIFSTTISTLIITFLYIMMFLVSIKKTDFINKEFMLSLGVLTYPLYLIHENIGFIMLRIFGEQINRHVLLVILIAFMIFIAYLINRFIEKKYSVKLKELLQRILK